MGSLLEKCFAVQGGALNSSLDASDRERLRSYLGREPHNRIFNMAATKVGTNEAAILKLSGEIGMEALQEMLNDEILIRDAEGRITYHTDRWISGNVDDALLQVKQSVSQFDKSLVGTDGSALLHCTGAIRKELLPEVKALISEFAMRLNQMKDASENEGTVHFYCNLVYNLYDKSELD